MTKILILGGTSEAAALAGTLVRRWPGLDVTTSLAGVLRDSVDPPGTVRRGGFGGCEGLARHLREDGIDMLVDATHPFAATMAASARAAAERAGIPRIKLLRPMWRRTGRDHWIEVDDTDAAVHVLARHAPEAVLVTLGSRDLDPFAALGGMRLVLRMIEAPVTSLPSNAEVILQRGPFEVADEVALMRRHGIGMLVTKASGGAMTEAKIVAARELRLPVVMIRRPDPPPGPVAGTVDEVARRLAETLALRARP